MSNKRAGGLTLIELLIAMLLGVVVTGTLISTFSTTVRYNSDNLQMIRLNQELRGVMSLISRDLRRAGYFNSATTTTTYLDIFGGDDIGGVGYNNCIFFAYDIDADGVVEDGDLVAYRLDGGKVYQGKGDAASGDPAGLFNCGDDDITATDPTDNVSWQAITEYDSAANDRSDVQISTLQFEPECSLAGGSVSSSFTCATGDVEVRTVVITITGQVVTPVDNTVISRTLTETVKLRNDGGI